jgi:hypothetical protein
MRQRLRSHLTYANVMATLAVFIALGGTALASVIITSNSQVAQGTISGHKPPSGKHPNIIGGSVNGTDVSNNSLTGADIANQSNVEGCKSPLLRRGELCAFSDGTARTLGQAFDYCTSNKLHLPTATEGIAMAKNYDVPGVGSSQQFWTDSLFVVNSTFEARTVTETGSSTFTDAISQAQTVCVTDPSV